MNTAEDYLGVRLEVLHFCGNVPCCQFRDFCICIKDVDKQMSSLESQDKGNHYNLAVS